MNNVANTSGPCILRPGQSWLDEYHVPSAVLNRPCYVAIPPADVKNCSGWSVSLHRQQYAAISVTEPERGIFHRETGLIPILRIGHSGMSPGRPEAVFIDCDVASYFRKVD